MNASLLQSDSLAGQVRSLLAAVDRLQAEVGELRRENAELRQQVIELRREAGYWKSRHADAVQRNILLQAELEQAQAEIRQLKAERFGKQSEKQSATDRSNQLADPQEKATPRKKRGQQPNRPAPKRRDYSHLPVREEQIDLLEDAKVCACCGQPLADLGQSDATEAPGIGSGRGHDRGWTAAHRTADDTDLRSASGLSPAVELLPCG